MKIRLTLWALCFAAAASTAYGGKYYNLPPAQRLLEPGPGIGGPGPGVIIPPHPDFIYAGSPIARPTVQVLFDRPEGMQVNWDVGGIGQFDSEPLIVPGRSEFPQGGIYRLKLSNIPGPGREGVDLYPTLEVGPATPRTEAYLAHNAVPVQFNEDDLIQVMAGNYVTKVIYLPDPEFVAADAAASVESLVSTRLDPGVDPIVEADHRGSILAIVRVGNKDIELAGGIVGGGIVSHADHFAADGAMVMPVGPSGLVPQYVAGVSVPQYGMPISGTPIGLPGPPHVPHGIPAGLQNHVMKNHTMYDIPEPTKKFKIHVRQQPGLSYPKPPSRMHIREQYIHPGLPYGQPHDLHSQMVK